jgi:hypothetical protein
VRVTKDGRGVMDNSAVAGANSIAVVHSKSSRILGGRTKFPVVHGRDKNLNQVADVETEVSRMEWDENEINNPVK